MLGEMMDILPTIKIRLRSRSLIVLTLVTIISCFIASLFLFISLLNDDGPVILQGRSRSFPGRIARFLSWEQNVPNYKESDGLPGTAVHYKGCSGLGHRLLRQSSAFHLVSALNISFLQVDWGNCQRTEIDADGNETTEIVELFSYLFGSEPLRAPKLSWKGGPRFGIRTRLGGVGASTAPNVTFFATNEVRGYGEFTKELKVMLDRSRSDILMYRQLILRFRRLEEIEEFFWTNELSKHTVYGVHIRAGNDEKGDFTDKKRGIQAVETEVWINNIANLIREHFKGNSFGASHMAESCEKSKKPPIVFVATDTPGTIDMLRRALQEDEAALPSIPVISYPQKYAAKGVTYAYSFGMKYDRLANDCLLGWENQVIDMVMLSMSDVLVAGMYSSFTQAMPIPLVISPYGLGKHEDYKCNRAAEVCDVSVKGDAMKCYQTMEDWLFKRIAKVGDDISGGKLVGGNSSYFAHKRFKIYPMKEYEGDVVKIIETLNDIGSKEKITENSGKRAYFCLGHQCPLYAPFGAIPLY